MKTVAKNARISLLALLTVLLMPLYLPILLFAVGAVEFSDLQQQFQAMTALLLAINILLFVVMPYLIGACLRLTRYQ